jgi:SAM-dependent methyltransferase
MRTSLLALLACPDCGGDVELAQGDTIIDDDVVNGVLECTGCNRDFIIQRRFPLMLPKAFDALQKAQMAAWDSQLDATDSNLGVIALGMVEVPMLVHALDLDPDYTLLDAGCGTGRMSVQLAGLVKELVCVDFSLKSLEETDRKLRAGTVRNVHLIQGDICHLPLKKMLFGRALASQVLEHIPTSELRDLAVAEIGRTVLPGSTIIISAFQHSMFSKEKSGEHSGGLYYLRFTEHELTELLEKSLDVKSVSGLLVYLYLATCSRPL